MKKILEFIKTLELLNIEAVALDLSNFPNFRDYHLLLDESENCIIIMNGKIHQKII